MLLLAKVGVGIGATMVLAGAWVFHEGVINVAVDEGRPGGSHVHLWVPATAVSTGLRVVPRRHLQQASEQARQFLPMLREISKELDKYPNAQFVDVRDSRDHVSIAMRNGKLYVDAVTDKDTVHVSVPAVVLRDVADRLEDAAPGI